jgi:hypothetical protein
MESAYKVIDYGSLRYRLPIDLGDPNLTSLQLVICRLGLLELNLAIHYYVSSRVLLLAPESQSRAILPRSVRLLILTRNP